MDALANATTPEAMVISDPTELGTADGGPGVDLGDSSLTKDGEVAMAVDKENDGGQRAGVHYRSSALADIFFGTQPPNPPSEGDTHSLSGNTPSPAAAATSTASPLTAASVGARARRHGDVPRRHQHARREAEAAAGRRGAHIRARQPRFCSCG